MPACRFLQKGSILANVTPVTLAVKKVAKASNISSPRGGRGLQLVHGGGGAAAGGGLVCLADAAVAAVADGATNVTNTLTTKGGKHEVGSNGCSEKCAWASLHSYTLRPRQKGPWPNFEFIQSNTNVFLGMSFSNKFGNTGFNLHH